MSHLPEISSGRLTFLTEADTAAVLDLYLSCPDYFLLQDGELPQLADAEDLFTDVPSSKSTSDLSVIGYWQRGTLAGVASLLANYPNHGDWYLGLLLLRHSSRGRGLGRLFYSALETRARGHGASRMLLSVFQDDHRALSLWTHFGFQHLRTVPPSRFKKKSHVRHEMVRSLCDHPPADDSGPSRCGAVRIR